MILLAIMVVFYQCKHDRDLDIYRGQNPDHPTVSSSCDSDTIYFQNEILPLLISNCSTSGCHDSDSKEEDVILVDYASVLSDGKIKTGDAEGSKLYKQLLENDPEERMPPAPNNPLTQDQKNMIKKWINQGARNNYCDGDCDTLNVSFSGSVWPTLQTNCVGCHSGVNPEGNITMSDYNSVVVLVANGSLHGAITHDPNYSSMPKNGSQLSDCKIAEIKIWIEDGTPNN